MLYISCRTNVRGLCNMFITDLRALMFFVDLWISALVPMLYDLLRVDGLLVRSRQLER